VAPQAAIGARRSQGDSSSANDSANRSTTRHSDTLPTSRIARRPPAVVRHLSPPPRSVRHPVTRAEHRRRSSRSGGALRCAWSCGGIDDWLRELQEARRGSPRPERPSITPAEVLGMIDRVIAGYGLDLREATDPQGWRRLSLGSAECRAGVIRWSQTERYLVVFSPLLRLPTKSRQLGRLYRLLLELNHEATQGARFSIRGEILFVSITRPIRGLDEVEMEEWHRKGHPVDPTENGISLRAKVGEKNYALGNLAPALARHPGTIILAWRALQRYQVFPPEAIEAFQTAVSASTSLTYTETNAHLAVTEEFGKEAAKALVRELDRLAQTGDPARDVEVAFAWGTPRWPLPGRSASRPPTCTGTWPRATTLTSTTCRRRLRRIRGECRRCLGSGLSARLPRLSSAPNSA